MSSSTVELFVAAYGTEHEAGAALKDFQAAQRAGSIDLIDAAVIVHTAEDKIKFEETADPSGKKWAKRGAIAGGVVGLIFPPSIIAGAVVGGGWPSRSFVGSNPTPAAHRAKTRPLAGLESGPSDVATSGPIWP